MPTMPKTVPVVTYQSSNGRTVTLSVDQIAMLDSASMWLRDSRGSEYCSVAYGEHYGHPTYTDDQIRRIARLPEPVPMPMPSYV